MHQIERPPSQYVVPDTEDEDELSDLEESALRVADERSDIPDEDGSFDSDIEELSLMPLR